MWLMPGIFDCHAHLSCFEDDTLKYLQMPTSEWVLHMAANARALLDMGVTFVRDPGGADAGVRNALAAGLVDGPTLQVAVSALSQTGGHTDGFLAGLGVPASNGFILHDYPNRPPYVADGPDGVVRAVREILRAGADWIKVCTTGGLLGPLNHDDPDTEEFSAPEINAITAEARKAGRPVMAHAYGGDGLTNAVVAGVRSIEHGVRLSEEQASLMADRGCSLVPTLAIMHQLVNLEQGGDVNDASASRVRDVGRIIGDAVKIAVDAGVRIAVGSDLVAQEGNLRELKHLGDAGMTPEQVLLAATINGAELCGVADTYGRIEPGYVLDAIALRQDPTDLAVFGSDSAVVGVLKHGGVHRWSE
ncbi:amidohydrolase family protein [Rhodococcus sp. IC4_135]|uniref:metal-dependent hydrolase family protein n=1 Tax=Rhodococcus sp. IC4_135 TaxID=2715537 RepID=UPI0032168B94